MNKGRKVFNGALVLMLVDVLSQKKVIRVLRFIIKEAPSQENKRVTAFMIDQAFPEEEKTKNGNKMTELLQETGIIEKQSRLSQPQYDRENMFFRVTALYRILPKELRQLIEDEKSQILTKKEIEDMLK